MSRIYSVRMKRMVVMALVIVTVVVALLVQVVRVYDRYGEWRLSATKPPLRVGALGREYDRSRFPPADDAPSGFVSGGTTDSGDTLLTPEGMNGRTPVIIYVEDESRVWEYSLVGGP
jgi:hypothetical protein